MAIIMWLLCFLHVVGSSLGLLSERGAPARCAILLHVTMIVIPILFLSLIPSTLSYLASQIISS
jgi:hypothetical protein